MDKVMIMAGRTGGHLMPALVLYEYLKKQGKQMTWLAATGGMENAILDQHGIEAVLIPPAPLKGLSWAQQLLFPLRLLRAMWHTLRIFWRAKPDLAIGMGGYVSGIGGLCARLCGCRLAIHEANVVAGLANRLCAPLAHWRFCAFDHVQGLGKPVFKVGNPLRASFFEQRLPLSSPREHKPRIVIMGGSQGARVLNQVLPEALAKLRAPCTVWHQAGPAHSGEVELRYKHYGVQAQVVDFVADPASVLASADVVVCRSGAMTLSELGQLRKAAILVPFARAAGNHQLHNARFFEAKGAAWVVLEQELLECLPAKLSQLLSDPSCRRALGEQAAAITQAEKAEALMAARLFSHR